MADKNMDTTPKQQKGIDIRLTLPADLAEQLQEKAGRGASLPEYIHKLVTEYSKYPLGDVRGWYVTGDQRAEMETAIGHALQSPGEITQHIHDAGIVGLSMVVDDGSGTKVPLIASIHIDLETMKVIAARNYEQMSMVEFVRERLLKKALELFVNGRF